jgi:hypothetical protein
MKYIHNFLFINEGISNSSDTKLFVKLFCIRNVGQFEIYRPKRSARSRAIVHPEKSLLDSRLRRNDDSGGSSC